MNVIDRIYTAHPEYGSRRISVILGRDHDRTVNRKRVIRLMRIMGISGKMPGPNTSRPSPENKVFPYLLRNVEIDRCDQVWSTDITYIRIGGGFAYLTAVIDWHSRYVLSWELSNSMDSSFCVEATERALKKGTPEIFNTDQGSQYTSGKFQSLFKDTDIKVSMDGRGRALDNVFVERLWRTVKYENVYLNGYETLPDLYRGLIRFFHDYNNCRPHQSLNNRTPAEVYRGESRRREPCGVSDGSKGNPGQKGNSPHAPSPAPRGGELPPHYSQRGIQHYSKIDREKKGKTDERKKQATT
jgi:putative transposase